MRNTGGCRGLLHQAPEGDMLIRRGADIPLPKSPTSAFTSDAVSSSASRGSGPSASASSVASTAFGANAAQSGRPPRIDGIRKGPFGTDEAQTPYEDVTTYNNFYEFGTDKASPAQNAGTLQHAALDREGRRRVRQAGRLRPRRPAQAASRSRSASTGCAASRAGRW